MRFKPTFATHVQTRAEGERYLCHRDKEMQPREGYDGSADARLALLREGFEERRAETGVGRFRCVCCKTRPIAHGSCYCIDCKRDLGAEVRLLRAKHGPPPDGGVCCICSRAQSRSLCLDHCHATGVARGYVCQRCNAGMSLVDNHRSLFHVHMERFKR